MDGLFPAPIAELLIFDLPLHQLLVLIGVIITPLAHGAAERYQPIGSLYFSHGKYGTTEWHQKQMARHKQKPALPSGLQDD